MKRHSNKPMATAQRETKSTMMATARRMTATMATGNDDDDDEGDDDNDDDNDDNDDNDDDDDNDDGDGATSDGIRQRW